MTLVIIDGHSVAYRSYFALIRRPLRDPRGRNTSAVYGFLNALDKIEARYPTDYMIISFDAGRKVFRHEQFADYKKDRKPMPDDLVWQIPMITDIARIQGLPVLMKEGYEADDIMGTLIARYKNKFNKIVIVSGDKDLMQLVDNKVVMYDPYKNLEYDAEAVEKKMGVPPERVTDLLALMGDASDGVPGIPGIGPKRAKEVLDRYGDLKTALDKNEKLSKYREIAELSYQLVQLHMNVPVDISEAELKRAEPDDARLQELYNELGFTSRLSRMKSSNDKTTQLSSKKFNPQKGDPISFVFEEKTGQANLFSTAKDEGNKEGYEWEKILASDGFTVTQITGTQARALLADKDFPKILWTAKPLLHKGYKINGKLWDLRLMAFVENSDLSLRTLDRILVHSAGRAIANDADKLLIMHQAGEQYEKELKNVGAWNVYEKIELPLTPILTLMEQRGVRLDTVYFTQLTAEWEKELNKLEEEIHNLAGENFSIASTKQLGNILFERLGLRPRKRTKTGYSTAAGVLEEMVSEHPIIPKVLEWRAFSKMLTTYLRPLVTLVDNQSRIHTSFDQTGAATGRLSTHTPNLQNIPMRGERGPIVRKGFTAAPGYKLISADYSQIELRVLAHIAADEVLAKVFHDGRDVHTETSMRVFGIKENEVTRDHRRKAKVINYGILYGMGPFGFARRMGVTTEEAAAFIERYLSNFPGVSAWREQILVEAREQGYVKTISGRVRRLPLLSGRTDIAERAAINAPIQGSAADIIKVAMIAVEANLRKANIEPGMILQIHDELLFEVSENKVEDAKQIIKRDMESAWKLSVPLEVDIGVGDNWAEAH